MLKKLLFYIFLISSITVYSQDSTAVAIDTTFTIVDTWRATPIDLKMLTISQYHINDSVMNTPASVTVLTSADMLRNNKSDISAVLNTVPGVLMQSGGINTNRISIRGIGARTPYGTNKIRAFYGSIPLTSGDSETTIEDIDLDIIDRTEIIKGPLSSVYGAGLGGAILLQPKQLKTPGTLWYISPIVGSFGLVKSSIRFSLDRKAGSLNISYNKLQTDGWRDNSAYYREGITLSGEVFRKANSKLTYFGNYTYLKAYIPSSINKETFDNNPQAAAPTWAASKGYEKYNSYMGGLAYDWKPAPWLKNSTSVFVSAKDNYEPRPFDILTQDNTAFGGRTQFSGDFTLGKQKSQFIAGIEYFHDGFDGGTYENLYEDNNGKGTLQGAQLTGSKQKRNFINAFAQLRVPIIKHLEMQAGLNYNKTNFDLDITYPADALRAQDYNYDGIWSPQVSLLFKPSDNHTFYASVSRGFSLPSIEETLTANGTINPNIKPENGYNYEVGGKFYSSDRNLSVEIALYRMEIKDLLVAQRVGDDQYVGVNAGKTLHQGIEASVMYNWDINARYTLQPYMGASIGYYEFKEFVNNGIDYSGNDLTGVPANKINAGFMFDTTFGAYLSADYYYVDDIPMNDANTAYAHSYNLMNAKAGYHCTLFDELMTNFSFGVNNITDTHYASMVLVNATGVNGAAPRYYYPGLPVNYYGSVSFSYYF